MNLPSPKICKRIRQLFLLIGSANENEAKNARDKLTTLLAKHALTWHDIPAVVAAADADDASVNAAKPRSATPPGPTAGPEVNVLDLVLRLLELHVALSAEERMAVALWILHTHVFDNFTITPRLALLSPVRGCGKTTLLALLDLLAAGPYRSDNVTAAAIYYLLDYRPHTFLIDEGDNLGLLNNPVLRAVFNSGHRFGGAISRFVGGRSRRYPTFAPLAVAAIGMMPLPLLHRAIIINMQRASVRLERFDENNPKFAASREQIARWATTCSLAQDPDMPPSLRYRAADNWRVLFAIADDLRHGEEARAAAVALNSGRLDEDPGVLLLIDIRVVFEALGVDRIVSTARWIGAVRMTIARPTSSTKLSLLGCCAGSESGRKRSGQCRVSPAPRAVAATCAASLRKHGRPTVPQATQRHTRGKSYTYRGRDPPHWATHYDASARQRRPPVLRAAVAVAWPPVRLRTQPLCASLESTRLFWRFSHCPIPGLGLGLQESKASMQRSGTSHMSATITFPWCFISRLSAYRF